MSILPPDDAKGFGKAVRLASTHGFESHITRFQAGDLFEAMERARVRKISLFMHGAALLAFVMLSSWCGQVIGTAIVKPLGGFGALLELFGAVMLAFLGVFAFMRLTQAALRALFDVEDDMEWPRLNVDWGKQAVVLDRDGLAIANRLVRRTYRWDSMAELIEDDVFVVRRKHGSEIVIPKDPNDEDELRNRLMRGITMAQPVSRSSD